MADIDQQIQAAQDLLAKLQAVKVQMTTLKASDNSLTVANLINAIPSGSYMRLFADGSWKLVDGNGNVSVQGNFNA